MIKSELIISVACEGGGADIYRTADGSGGWQFYLGGITIALDKDGTDVWKQWNCTPVDTIEQALDRVDRDGGWLHFIPPEIHSEYRPIAWELAQQLVRTHPSFQNWEQARGHRWRSKCFPELNSGDGN